MRILELFSGIGGLAAAVHGRADIVGAVDHDRRAQQVYAANWPHPVQVKNLVSVKPAWLAGFEADLWWMSPPCAPHGIRGKQDDLDDPRSAAFRHLMDVLPDVGPRHLALENVPWFHGSRAWDLLESSLARAGYTHLEHAELCPSAFGWPNRRRRVYAVASRDPLVRAEVVPSPVTLPELVGPWRDDLRIDDDLRARFGDALHVVDADDPEAVTATFTRAYGRSPVYAGSYLRQHDGEREDVRTFSPVEIARLMGFPDGFHVDDLPPRHAWKLVGNSVSVPVVRHVLSWLAGTPLAI